MKLFLLTQNDNRGYDTYDSAVVVAETEEDARKIHPHGAEWGAHTRMWADYPDRVKVELLGEAIFGTNSGVVLASFNAG